MTIHTNHTSSASNTHSANSLGSTSSSHTATVMTSSPKPPPHPSQPPSSVVSSASWRLWVIFIGLVVLSVCSGWALLEREWTRPLSELFLPSLQLDIASMATQLHLVATSVVALLAGGLVGVVSILLQQLVKSSLPIIK